MASKGKTPAAVTAQVLTSSPIEQTTPINQLPGPQFAALLAAIRESEHRLDRKLVDFRGGCPAGAGRSGDESRQPHATRQAIRI